MLLLKYTAGYERPPSTVFESTWPLHSISLHTQPRSNWAEGSRAQQAVCTSPVLTFHAAIIKKRSFPVATWRSHSNKPTASHSFHLASGKSLPVWTHAISTCPRRAVLGFFFPPLLILLKRINQLLQPGCSLHGKRWPNIIPFANQITTDKSTFKRCLQQLTYYKYICEVHVSW